MCPDLCFNNSPKCPYVLCTDQLFPIIQGGREGGAQGLFNIVLRKMEGIEKDINKTCPSP